MSSPISKPVPPAPGEYITSEFLSRLAGQAPVGGPSSTDEKVVQTSSGRQTVRLPNRPFLARVFSPFSRRRYDAVPNEGADYNWSWGQIRPFGLKDSHARQGSSGNGRNLPDENYEELEQRSILCIDPSGAALTVGTRVMCWNNPQTGLLEVIPSPGPAPFTSMQFETWGFPSGGNVLFKFDIPDPDDGYEYKQGEDIVVPWNASSEDFAMAMAEHPSIHGLVRWAATNLLFPQPASVEETLVLVEGGPWPSAALCMHLMNRLSDQYVDLPYPNVGGLTGGIVPNVLLSKVSSVSSVNRRPVGNQ